MTKTPSPFKRKAMKKRVLTPAQKSVVRMLGMGRILLCDDASRCEPLFWITTDGRRRVRGPCWPVVESLERKRLLRVKKRSIYGRQELVIRLKVKKSPS